MNFQTHFSGGWNFEKIFKPTLVVVKTLAKASKKKKIHFIGIGGTAMASLAVAFSRAGFEVTGSEPHKIFPPMSDVLQKNKVKYYFPFNPKKIGSPDEIVIGNAHYSDSNPEVVYARQNNIELEHFPCLVEKYLIAKNSIVVAGTYAKTTSSAMLTWILETAGRAPNYLIAGAPLNFKLGARLGLSNWSIVEGDEYPAASPWDFSPKFSFYHPKYLLLTSADWDHMDIYKTPTSYINVFKKLVASVPKNGLIVAKADGENISQVIKKAKAKTIFYTTNKETVKNKKIYFIDNIQFKNKKMSFTVFYGQQKIANFETKILGEFNLENWCAAIALAHQLKIPISKIISAVKTFKGVKRRLEIRIQKGVTVIDDFAHAPAKARQSILSLKKHFPASKIFVIFEPNRGGRSAKCATKYNHVFAGVQKVFIPKLSEYKSKPGVVDLSGRQLAQVIKKTQANCIYQPDNQNIFKNLIYEVKPGDVIAFLGSRDFGGLLDQTIKKFG